MTGQVLPLLVALPLLVGGGLAARAWSRRVVAASLLATTGAILLLGLGLIGTHAGPHTVLAHQVGLWPAGIAIPFVSDMFSALMITVTGLLMVTCCAFAIAVGETRSRFFAPLVLVLCAGVTGALLTGDVFNLFVFVEVMLLPSYGLIAMVGSVRRIGAGRLYVTVNLLTSTIFLFGVGLIYGLTGTVNLAELAGAARASPSVAVATGIVLIAMGIKASVVPMHGWLTRTYPATSAAVTALFSGLHTKVAVYAIYRIYSVVFDGDDRYLWVGLVLMAVTMVVGVLGALGENRARTLLAFQMVSGIGYILLGVFLFGPLGLTAGIFYLIHHMIVKTSLFLSTGAVDVTYGTHPLGAVRGMVWKEPLMAAAFMVGALSLAGFPPFSGFAGKVMLVWAAVEAEQLTLAIVIVVVSLLTLMALLNIWSSTFWGSRDGGCTEATAVGGTTMLRSGYRIRPALAAPSVVLALATVVLGVGAQGLLALAEQAAAGLVDTSGYVEAVTGG